MLSLTISAALILTLLATTATQPAPLHVLKIAGGPSGAEANVAAWDIPITFAPGSYRAEILLDDKPMWRGFVQITP